MTRPKLSIAIPTHEDTLGLWPTIQSLRIHHAAVMSQTEFIVVDQAPNTAHGKAARDFMTWVKGDVHSAKYVPAPDPPGSAPAKGRAFAEASGEVVVCMDSHVLLWPGALERLLAYFATNPGSKDLLAGPMVYDNMVGCSTHLKNEWSGEQWGTWGEAKRCRCGAAVEILASREGLTFRTPDYQGEASGTGCPRCGNQLYPQQGMSLDDAITAAGFTSMIHDNGEPFEVWAHGTGLLACRKEAWPGFAEGMRGFGAEEVLIHERFRKRGGKSLCAPWLRWTHRFLRPDGPRYPLRRWDKVRNFVLGFRDVGLDLAPVYQHFVLERKMPEVEWNAILAGAVEPPEEKKAGCGSCGGGNPPAAPQIQPHMQMLESWYEYSRQVPHDINEHSEALRRLAGKVKHVTEFGSRPGISTVALLAGAVDAKGKFVSYAPSPYAEASQLKKLGGDHYEFRAGGSLEAEIEPTQLLFLDTDPHTADHVYAELARHAPKATKVVLHDTTSFGERGSDGGPGILPALRRWMTENPEWSVVKHWRNNNGLILISRDPADRKPLPGILKQAWNFAAAMTRHKLNGGKYLPLPMAEERLKHCAVCESRSGERCSECGCFVRVVGDDAPVNAGQPGKAFFPLESCPLSKWTAQPSDGVDMTPEEVKAMLEGM